MIHTMLEANQTYEDDLEKRLIEQLEKEQEDADTAEQKKTFVEKRERQIGFLLNVWPRRERMQSEPSESYRS